MLELRPFQRRFLKAATVSGTDTAALSLPRGNGKSALAGHLLARILDPGDKLFGPVLSPCFARPASNKRALSFGLHGKP